MSLPLIVGFLIAGACGFCVCFAFFRMKVQTLREIHASAISNAILEVEKGFSNQLGVANAQIEAAEQRIQNLNARGSELSRQLEANEELRKQMAEEHSALQILHSSINTVLGEREQELQRLKANYSEATQLISRLQEERQGLELREGALAARLDEFQTATKKRAEDEVQLKEAFRLLANDALSKSNEAFLPMAKQTLADQQKEVKDDLGKRHEAVDGLLQPMKELLTKLQQETQALEVKRQGAYEGLLAEVKNIKETHESLRGETRQLVAALRDSGTRGNWGAVQLKRCLEFAGMLEYCCFELEKSVRTDNDETQRPDCVVTLPGDRTIVIDAKTPMKAFLDALAATDDVERETHLRQHARQLKTHLQSLQSKAYWKQFRNSPDFVICFLPKEALLSAALSQDPELITFEDGKVLLATPTTLIALMRVIAFGWKQIALARDAQQIHALALSVYDKLASMHDSFEAIGRGIKNTAVSWEKMRTQVEGKGGVFSLGKRLQKLDISKKELADVQEIQLGMHDLQSDDWSEETSILLPALAAESSTSTENPE